MVDKLKLYHMSHLRIRRNFLLSILVATQSGNQMGGRTGKVNFCRDFKGTGSFSFCFSTSRLHEIIWAEGRDFLQKNENPLELFAALRFAGWAKMLFEFFDLKYIIREAFLLFWCPSAHPFVLGIRKVTNKKLDVLLRSESILKVSCWPNEF